MNDDLTEYEEALRVAPLGWVPAGWFHELEEAA
jgi:hypothetical protein